MKTYSRQTVSRLSPISRVLGVSTMTLSAAAAMWFMSSAVLNTQGSRVSVLEATYSKTSTDIVNGRQTTTTEEGRFHIAADGRYRKDYTVGGRSITLLGNARTGSQITLDHSSREAVHGPPAFPVPESSLPRFNADIQSDTVSIGQKTVGGIVLHGHRVTQDISAPVGQISFTFEIWQYRFDDATSIPIRMEHRFESANSIEEQRIVNVVTTDASGTVFNVPSGYTVR